MFELNKIHNVDARVLLGAMESGSVDLIVADPPYGEKQATWDSEKPDNELWAEYFRVLKEGGVIYYWGFWGHADWVLSNAKRVGFEPMSRIIWWFRTGRPEKKSYREDTEECWYMSKGEPKTFNAEQFLEPYEDTSNYERYGRKGKHPGTVWIHTRILHNHPENIEHETQKPEALIEKIVLISSNAGDLVVDPFVGSGTTALQCERHKRQWLACDTDSEYCMMATERIERWRAQGVLDFDQTTIKKANCA